MSGDEVRAALRVWREGLVGLTRANRLLNFRAPKRSSVLIGAPSADDVLDLVRSDRPLKFDSSVPPAVNADIADSRRLGGPPRDTLRSPLTEQDLGVILRTLMRRASEEYLDKGLTVLYLAFGMLHWHDTDGTKMMSPLLLVPVTLLPEGPRGTPRLQAGEDDAVVNPALTLRLKGFNINLPAADGLEDTSVTGLLSAARLAVERASDFKDWNLSASVHLATFSFAKEAMYKDLLDNERRILEHPIVRALGTSDPMRQSREFQFDPIDPGDIDSKASPEVTPLVLDADSSQRVAVAAALAGRTFVMDGPPGTGKSQTIANMIGALMHAGKTVLFVSEKIAALDVVKNRLADVGLGAYLLELHSHTASRKVVAAELLRSLDTIVVPPREMDPTSRTGVRSRREKLNGYAAAMNERRDPLGVNLHEVLGRLAEMHGTLSAPVPREWPAALSAEGYAAVRDQVSQLVRAWRPAAQGSTFLWRDVVDESSLEIRLYQARMALEKLQGTVELVRDVATAFHMSRPSDATALSAILDRQHRDRPDGVVSTWLSREDWRPVASAREDLFHRIDRIRAADQQVFDAAGTPWTSLRSLLPRREMPVVTTSGVAPLDLTDRAEPFLRETADRFEKDSGELTGALDAVQNLAVSLGLPGIVTFEDAEALFRVVDLRRNTSLPERAWLSAAGLDEARRAVMELYSRKNELAAAEARARGTFNADALRAPIAELQDRFAHLHRGLKKLSAGYRSDKQLVVGLLKDARSVKVGIEHLTDAAAWGDALRAYESAAVRHRTVVGRYWDGQQVDYNNVAVAFTVADDALRLVGTDIGAALADYLSGATSDTTARAVTDSARQVFTAWRARMVQSNDPARMPQLLVAPIRESADWLAAHVAPMRQAADRLAAFTAATGRTYTVRAAESVLDLVDAACDAHEGLASEADSFRETLGDHFDFERTDLSRLEVALEWARQVRQLAGGRLSDAQTEALGSSHWIGGLDDLCDAWASARDAVLNAFDVTKRADLRRELDGYATAYDLIDALNEDTIGQQEWFEYRAARTALAALGLDAAIEFCAQRRVDAGDVPQILDRALLRAWADGLIHDDPRLDPVTTDGRDALVSMYREQDRELIARASTDIIRAANARRPANTQIGEPAVIRREGGKQRRHIPVRELIARSRGAIAGIKPVYMMSPLAVSQYLPPDMQFDVVICDEASQVTPGNAINCIYRGKALILAGDDKQLPPTSFFEHVVDDEDDDTDVRDFQSILELAKSCGAFNNLGLRWHYRSRHESLIAYSNYKFYEGKLVTYPSSSSNGDDQASHSSMRTAPTGAAGPPTIRVRLAWSLSASSSTSRTAPT